MTSTSPPGGTITRPGTITLNARLPVTEIAIVNTGPVPVHLAAHFHVFEANPALAFDRNAARGQRLDIPSGDSIRLRPGEQRVVRLVPIGGARVVRGFRGLIDGRLDAPLSDPRHPVGADGGTHQDQEPATSISSSAPVTAKTTRSQMLVTRSAIRSRLWAAQSRWVARLIVPGSAIM